MTEHPLQFSEKQNPNTVLEKLDAHEKFTRTSTAIDQAHLRTELALCHPDQNEAEGLLDEAEECYEYIIKEYSKSNSVQIAIDASIGLTYIDIFRKRVHGEEISSENMRELYGDFAHLLNAAEQEKISLPQAQRETVDGKTCEIIAIMVLLRTQNPDYFPYPGLIREEQSTQHRNMNHDIYLKNGDVKTAIQIKRSKQHSEKYDKKIAVLIISQIANAAAPQNKRARRHRDSNIQRLRDLLCREALNDHLTEKSIASLDRVSEFTKHAIQYRYN